MKHWALPAAIRRETSGKCETLVLSSGLLTGDQATLLNIGTIPGTTRKSTAENGNFAWGQPPPEGKQAAGAQHYSIPVSCWQAIGRQCETFPIQANPPMGQAGKCEAMHILFQPSGRRHSPPPSPVKKIILAKDPTIVVCIATEIYSE